MRRPVFGHVRQGAWTRVCLVLAGWLAAGGAFAQDPSDAASGEPPDPIRIGVFGDSLADGMWAGLYRHFRTDRAVSEVSRLAQASTGLTNYTYVDVADRTREQLAEADYDVAVVMFGANDIQGIAEDGAVYRFGTPDWETVYRARIRELIGLLREDGAAVYWVGLPKMRSARYDRNVVYLNSIYSEEAAALGAPFIDTREVSADEFGEYSAYLPDAAGTPRLMRADDGIHFTMPGYRRIAAPLAGRLRGDLDAINRLRLARANGEEMGPEAVAMGFRERFTLTVYGEDYICEPAAMDVASGEAGDGSAP